MLTLGGFTSVDGNIDLRFGQSITAIGPTLDALTLTVGGNLTLIGLSDSEAQLQAYVDGVLTWTVEGTITVIGWDTEVCEDAGGDTDGDKICDDVDTGKDDTFIFVDKNGENIKCKLTKNNDYLLFILKNKKIIAWNGNKSDKKKGE